jgi:hypothetical protein
MAKTGNKNTIDYPRGLTFEKVWAALMENRKQQEETARLMKEASRETREIRKQMKETDRIIGELGNRFGELAEHLVAPSITEKFNKLGFTFEQVSRKLRISDA